MTPIKKVTNDFTTALTAVVGEVVEGNESALKLSVVLSTMTKAIDEARKKIEEHMLQEAESYGQKTFSDYGAKFQITECGVKYDYSVIEGWSAIQQTIDDLKKEQKAIEDMAKHATPNNPYIDPVSGECINGIPRSSKTTIKITLNK